MRKVMLDDEAVDFDVAVNMMDFDICEELHNKLAPCTDQEFMDEYCKAHQAKFGEEFIIN